METLEVHLKDFLVKWVNVPESLTVDWQVKPLKRSVNFSIYRKNDYEESNNGVVDDKLPEKNGSSTTLNSTNGSNSRVRSTSVTSVNRITEPIFKTKSRSSTLNNNINNGDLTLVKNYNKLIADELVHGQLDIEKPGIYAFIFDNSFSKTTGKKILFSTKLVSKQKPVVTDYASPEDTGKSNVLRPKNGELLQSVLLKKRRKKLQGFVKRYFVLNIKYGTLSYFRMNDNKLRGQMPINQSIISANAKRLEIIIDSGMEVWDLKALNKADFDVWTETFNKLKKNYYREEGATYHKEIGRLDDESNPNLPSYIIEELNIINTNVAALMLHDSNLTPNLASISNDLSNLILRVKGYSRNSAYLESMSMFSANEFYDAKEYFDALNGGVVHIDQYDFDDESDDVVDDSESSNTDYSSPRSSVKDLSVITESVSHQSNLEDKDNSLYPLPLEPVERKVVIPVWTTPPPSILSFFRKNVGKDLTSIAMPVDMNEPVTILQKYAELIEYCDLINNALEVHHSDDKGERILRIAAFAVSGFASFRDKERSLRKPFNPLLGETFELVREDKGIRLISEKVSHRPPVFATLVESADWSLSWSLSPSQKFWGKTAEIHNKGTLKLVIKSTGQIYQWTQPPSMLKNIIAGEKYSEPSGSMTIKSSDGSKAVVEFAKGGMFSGRSEDLTIEAFDHNKKKLAYSVFGTWTESLTLKTSSTEKLIWTSGELIPDSKKRFGFTQFANELVQVTEIEKDNLAPTDSRLRPDLQAYLNLEVDKAEQIKCDLEERQRTRRKEMEVEKKKHQPLFFHHIGGTTADTGEWVYTRGEDSYWNRRAAQNWSGLLDLW